MKEETKGQSWRRNYRMVEGEKVTELQERGDSRMEKKKKKIDGNWRENRWIESYSGLQVRGGKKTTRFKRRVDQRMDLGKGNCITEEGKDTT